jgi:hypothetical protein
MRTWASGAPNAALRIAPAKFMSSVGVCYRASVGKHSDDPDTTDCEWKLVERDAVWAVLPGGSYSGGGGALGGLAAGAATVTLTDVQADQLEELLRGVTMERRDVRAVMGFALDHALAAADVVEMLVESLTLAETPFPTKVLWINHGTHVNVVDRLASEHVCRTSPQPHGSRARLFPTC